MLQEQRGGSASIEYCSFISNSYSHVISRTKVSLCYSVSEEMLLALKATMRATVAHFVTCNLCFSGQLVRLTLKIIMQNDGDFVEVILLYLIEPNF